MNQRYTFFLIGVLVLVLAGVVLPATAGATPDPLASTGDVDGTPAETAYRIDDYRFVGGDGTSAGTPGSTDAEENASVAGAGDGESEGIVAEPPPQYPPYAPEVARHLLSNEYYVAVLVVGVLASFLLMYAGTALWREPRSPDGGSPLPHVPETDGGRVDDGRSGGTGGCTDHSGCDCDGAVDDDRRTALTAAAGATTLAISGLGLHEADAEDDGSEDSRQAEAVGLVREHYKEMSDERKEQLVTQIEAHLREEFDQPDVEVSTTGPRDGVVFSYALNVQKCIGCRRCVYACVEENNQSRKAEGNPAANQIQWIRVLKFDDATVEPGTSGDGGTLAGTEMSSNFGHVSAGVNYIESDHYYPPEEAGEADSWYLPTQCFHCENPSCVRVCPVQATWKEDDGIVVVDYDRCIGCKYCVTNCPYGARRFNFNHPHLPDDELNPDMHYLGNRPRPGETVEKCSFCIQRSREGEYPACVESCPVGARNFGNLLDEDGEIRTILDEKRVFRLRPDTGNEPKFFYFSE